MGRKSRKDGTKISLENWQEHDDCCPGNEFLHSYIKKKGKHQRAQNSPTDKKL